jgi:hypothetical protein
VTAGNFPIQVRVPDSVPITRPTLNNPTETRTPIRMQDYRISSNPALAQLDADPELEIVVRSQMSDTLPSDGIEILSGVGHLNAYDHDGTYLWTAKMDSVAFYYGSAQEFITEGSNSPAVADIDGDGRDEVVSNPVLSLYAYPFNGDGTPFGASPWISPPLGLPDPGLPIPDVPVGFTTSGAFGMFGGALTFAQPGSGSLSIITALLTAGSGQPIVNKERAWNAATGAPLPGFPAQLQGLNFLGAPIFVDVTGDGLAEIVDGGDSSALHGYMVGGLQAVTAGFPKFTTGWILWSPTAGDLDSDGTVEVVANTREGYTNVWHTPGLASANVEWWRYGHDEWNTRRYGTDTRPPGILRAAVVDADARTLSFTAPGDDWYAGRPATVSHHALGRHGRRHADGRRGRLGDPDDSGRRRRGHRAGDRRCREPRPRDELRPGRRHDRRHAARHRQAARRPRLDDDRAARARLAHEGRLDHGAAGRRAADGGRRDAHALQPRDVRVDDAVPPGEPVDAAAERELPLLRSVAGERARAARGREARAPHQGIRAGDRDRPHAERAVAGQPRRGDDDRRRPVLRRVRRAGAGRPAGTLRRRERAGPGDVRGALGAPAEDGPAARQLRVAKRPQARGDQVDGDGARVPAAGVGADAELVHPDRPPQRGGEEHRQDDRARGPGAACARATTRRTAARPP